MKESQLFQDGRTLEPLEVIVVRDRSAQLRPASATLGPPDSELLPSLLKPSHGSAAAAGLVGLVLCSGAFLGLGHVFGVLAQNWEGGLSAVSLNMERGWTSHLHQSWALADAPVAPDLGVLRASRFVFSARFYRHPFLAAVTAPIQPGSLREAFFDWRSLPRRATPLTTHEHEFTAGVEYSEERVVIAPVRVRPAVVADRRLRMPQRRGVVLSRARPAELLVPRASELSGPPQATLAERFAATASEIPPGFSWDGLSSLQAHPAPQVEETGAKQVLTSANIIRPAEHVVAGVRTPPPPVRVIPVSQAQVIERSVEPFDEIKVCGVPLQENMRMNLRKELWSRENAGAGWTRISGAGSWVTAYYSQPGSCSPVLTDSELNHSAQDAGRVLHRQLGIVFGRVASGWDVEISGRSSQDLFWGPVDPDGTRTFYWTNLPPGFATVKYFKHSEPLESGAVAVPVQTGVATQVDLTQIQKVTVAGHVLNGSQRRTTPMVAAEVVAIHHRSASVLTDRDGVFVFEPLWLPKGYPVDLDVQVAGNWPHRYSATTQPKEVQELNLYVMDSAQVRSWLAAFNGDLSAESALVVGAFSAHTRRGLGADVLLPQIEPWEKISPQLMPESYSLSKAGDLRPGRPMESGADRFLLVQVPGGPSKILFSDAHEKEVFSELRFQSPGVITIVGPF